MPDQSSRNAILFKRLLEGKLSADEIHELVKWLGAGNPDAEAARLVLEQLKQDDINPVQISPEIIAKLEARLPLITSAGKRRSATVIPVFKQKWMRYAAAVIILAGAGLYFFLNNQSAAVNKQVPVARVVSADEILPGKDGAILTLADGRTIALDSLGNGLVTMQNGTTVTLLNGQLVYDAGNAATAAVVYNTMTTPKGRQFQLVLPDGSKVWLNAASSIRYPTVFTDKERKVEITGEAYFEVSRNASLPFRVQVNQGTEIEVLGTHFNINSYQNEASVNTTLLEGSVRVRNTSGAIVLKPGQQARSSIQENIEVVNDVDVEQVMAWKNGIFNFHNASLQEVMRQLERWYDIEVVYEKDVPILEFYGKMGKDLSLEAVLSGLRKSNVHFRMEAGRKLVVLP